MDESVVRVFEEQKIGTIKLSQAIRIGAMLRPRQCKGAYFKPGASCVLGAAWEGMGKVGAPDALIFVAAKKLGLDAMFGIDLARRNDAGETREQIADWLQEQGL